MGSNSNEQRARVHRLGIYLVAAIALLVALAPTAVAASQTEAQVQEAAVSTALTRAKKVGTVDRAEVVSTTFINAQESVDPDAEVPTSISPSSRVELVKTYGAFTDTMAKMPRGANVPTGTEMAFIIDRETGLAEGIHLGGETNLMAQATSRRKATQIRPTTSKSVGKRHVARIASWGGGCSQVHHCYAIATWLMGAGEKVEGTQDNQDTTEMNVPGWQNGDFVDNEGWTVFEPSGYWVEAGNTSGEYYDCCSLHQS